MINDTYLNLIVNSSIFFANNPMPLKLAKIMKSKSSVPSVSKEVLAKVTTVVYVLLPNAGRNLRPQPFYRYD